MAPPQTTIIAEHRDRPCAVVFADGRVTEREKDATAAFPWAEHVRSEAAQYLISQMDLADGFELEVTRPRVPDQGPQKVLISPELWTTDVIFH